MRRRSGRGQRWAWALVAALCLALPGLALTWAQEGDKPAQPPSTTASDEAPVEDATGDEPPEEDEEEPKRLIIEHADHFRYEPDPEAPDDEDAGFYYLTGNTHLRHRDAHLYADECVYNIGEDTARAVGNLKLVQPDSTVTSDLMAADFDEEVAVATGNVRVVYQKVKEEEEGDEEGDDEKPAEEDDATEETEADPEAPAEDAEGEEDDRWAEYREKQTVVTCEKLTAWYEEDRALAEGSVVAVQKDKTVYADTARYSEADDTLILEGNPVRFERENGDHGTTPKATIYIEDEWFETDGFSGIITKRDKDDEDEDTEDEPEAPAPEPEPIPTPPEEPKAE